MNESASIALEELSPARSQKSTAKIQRTDLVRNTALNIVGQVLPLAAGVCLMPYIVKGLGPDRFGVLGIVWVIFNYFTVFDIGLGRATTKFLAESLGADKMTEVPGIIWTSFLLQAVLGLAGCVVLAGVAPVMAEKVLKVPGALVYETKITLWIVASSLPIVLITNGLRAVLEGCQRFDLSNFVKVPASALVFLIPAAALPFHVHLPGILFLLLVSRILVALAYLVLCLRVLPVLNLSVFFDRGVLPRLLTFGGWVTAGNIMNGILISLDRFLVGTLLSVAAVGYYTAPAEAVTKLLLVPTSLAATIFPAISALGIDRKKELSLLYSRSIKYLLTGLGPIAIVLCVFSREIIRVWLGPDFALKSAAVLGILAIGVFLNCFAHIPYSFLHGLGRPDSAAKLFMFELPIYTIVAWWGIRRWGISGAAAVWSLRVGIELVLFCFITWRSFSLLPYEIDDQGGTKKGSAALAGLVIVIIGTRAAFAGSVFAQAALVSVWLMVYASVSWFYVLDESDRASLLTLINPAITFTGRSGSA